MTLVLEKILKTSTLICPINAKKINKIIMEAVVNKTKIVIDFTNIKSVTLAFLYFSMKDVKKYYKGNLSDLIIVKNPTSFLFEEIEYLKKNYKELSKKFNKIEQNYILA